MKIMMEAILLKFGKKMFNPTLNFYKLDKAPALHLLLSTILLSFVL